MMISFGLADALQRVLRDDRIPYKQHPEAIEGQTGSPLK
jgi:hypothetical protein